jgi:hypothetical protein
MFGCLILHLFQLAKGAEGADEADAKLTALQQSANEATARADQSDTLVKTTQAELKAVKDRLAALEAEKARTTDVSTLPQCRRSYSFWISAQVHQAMPASPARLRLS